MKKRLPPAIVLIVHFGVAFLLKKYLILANFSISGQAAVSMLFGISGLALVIYSMYTLYRARTTIDPIFPEKATSLITTGPFSISRNPIYLALLLILMAWIIRLGNVVAVLLSLTFVWHLTRFQIKAEEEALEEKFGKAYQEYKLKVRRWI